MEILKGHGEGLVRRSRADVLDRDLKAEMEVRGIGRTGARVDAQVLQGQIRAHNDRKLLALDLRHDLSFGRGVSGDDNKPQQKPDRKKMDPFHPSSCAAKLIWAGPSPAHFPLNACMVKRPGWAVKKNVPPAG